MINLRTTSEICLQLLLTVAILMSGCSPSHSCTDLPKEFKQRPKPLLRVGLVLSSYGLGDESFNDMQYNGLIEAYRNFNIEIYFGISEAETVQAYRKVFDRLLQQNKCDVILAFHGFVMSKTASLYAPKHPQTPFIVINYPHTHYPNVHICSFATDEGSFLAGYLAAAFSKTKKTAMIIGVDIPALAVFRNGFIAGARYANPSATPVIRYCSYAPDFSGFESPKKGYRIATELYKSGIDVIYAAAGTTGNGIIQAARDRQKFVIGVDTDQDKLAPGFVLTSMMKRFDRVVYTMIQRHLSGKLLKTGRTYLFNLKNGGITLTPMTYTRNLIGPGIMQQLEQLQKMIISQQIRIK